ncbi:MAG: hypothetical protein Harvfovirus37_16 [Harvfovirus sp.]|uniref:Uncharacterized protein n=1 Tax=Harvfovirus sp. TaxID=2487768 RepID=A0A3G5A2Q8_9VIRU|nr:MAG: hypothetical protein Harvfovirus37_16 [Harvfovirus sp.]
MARILINNPSPYTGSLKFYEVSNPMPAILLLTERRNYDLTVEPYLTNTLISGQTRVVHFVVSADGIIIPTDDYDQFIFNVYRNKITIN